MSSYRPIQIGNLIHQALLSGIFELVDTCEVLSDASITKVSVSKDLKLATCYFVPCVTAKSTPQQMLKALNDSKSFLRKYITQEVKMKYSPDLRFFYDSGLHNALEVDDVLKKLV